MIVFRHRGAFPLSPLSSCLALPRSLAGSQSCGITVGSGPLFSVANSTIRKSVCSPHSESMTPWLAAGIREMEWFQMPGGEQKYRMAGLKPEPLRRDLGGFRKTLNEQSISKTSAASHQLTVGFKSLGEEASLAVGRRYISGFGLRELPRVLLQQGHNICKVDRPTLPRTHRALAGFLTDHVVRFFFH